MRTVHEPKLLEKISSHAARATGSSWAFLIALTVTLAWMISGPVFHFSSGWQLVMNTLSSVSTFMMVFLLQRSQIKDSVAMQIKLNEIIAAHHGAHNHLINIEDLSEEEIFRLRKGYQDLATKIKDTSPSSVETIMIDEHAESKPSSKKLPKKKSLETT